MIYVTGDTHGDFLRFHKEFLEVLPFELTEKDTMIVCGDFGLLWSKNECFEYSIEFLKTLPFTILWVTGNHENYDWIEEYAVETWHGGKVRHILRDKVILLERSQVFELEGKKYFTFGGASSHDIDGGILDREDPEYREKVERLEGFGISYRVNHLSWWKQELPTEEELEEGRKNLAYHDYKVDYIISHCGSNCLQNSVDKYYKINYRTSTYKSDRLTHYFDELEKKVEFTKWFCGHYHVNLELDEKHTILYEKIIAIEDSVS